MPLKYMKMMLVAALAVIAVAAVVWVKCSRSSSEPMVEVAVVADKEIAVTPQVVKSVRNIKQWEFVKLTDEEVVDTVRKVFLLPDDRLVLVFHGTPRIGIDLSDAPDDWVVNRNDSLTVTLPRPRLLDGRFIDEALTEVFAQRGRWNAADRERLYESARRKMMARALTRANLERARKAAVEKFTMIFESLGAEYVEVRFADSAR